MDLEVWNIAAQWGRIKACSPGLVGRNSEFQPINVGPSTEFAELLAICLKAGEMIEMEVMLRKGGKEIYQHAISCAPNEVVWNGMKVLKGEYREQGVYLEVVDVG